MTKRNRRRDTTLGPLHARRIPGPLRVDISIDLWLKGGGADSAVLLQSHPQLLPCAEPVAVPSIELIEAPGAIVSYEHPKQGLARTVLIEPISGSRHEKATDADSPALRIDVYSPELAHIL